MTSRADPIRVIEAAYDLRGSDAAWLTRLARAARPLLEGGLGVHAYTFDMTRPVGEWVRDRDVVRVGAAPAYVRAAIALGRITPTPAIRGLHRDISPLGLATEALRGLDIPEPPEWLACRRRYGAVDYLGLRTIEAGQCGVVLTGGQLRERPPPHWRTKRLWARVAVHLSAARRLRAKFRAHTVDAGDDEAILTPSGRCELAEGPAKGRRAREALRDAVLRQERARGRARRVDPEGAVEAWAALVSGRWSIVDRFESDGRRLLVARPNPVVVADPRELTLRELAVVHLAALGKSNKLIAYELGVSPSTVATQLTSAARKLGVASRVELLAYAAHAPISGTGDVAASRRRPRK